MRYFFDEFSVGTLEDLMAGIIVLKVIRNFWINPDFVYWKYRKGTFSV